MESIYTQILKLKNISCYNNTVNNQEIEEILLGNESASRYIYEYFQSGHKEEVVADWIKDISVPMQVRNLHAVNVYFISLVLCEQMGIQDEMKLISKNGILYPFKYLLYLACLAHDMGYMYEENDNTDDDNSLNRSRKNFYLKKRIPVKYIAPNVNGKKLGIRYGASKNFDYKIKFENGLSISKPWYSQRLKTDYLRYRMEQMKMLDHGIVGADLLFSKLVVNYKAKFKENEKRKEIDFDKFEDSYRIFCSEQFRIFAYIADCVAAHNVYMAADDKREIYIKYELQSLLPENFEKISFKKNPLLFLLCLADTLEPYKRFGSENDNITILKNISFEINQEEKLKVNVKLGDAGIRGLETNRKKYLSDIGKLSEWCDICVNISA